MLIHEAHVGTARYVMEDRSKITLEVVLRRFFFLLILFDRTLPINTHVFFFQCWTDQAQKPTQPGGADTYRDHRYVWKDQVSDEKWLQASETSHAKQATKDGQRPAPR